MDYSTTSLDTLAATLGCRITRCPPARDTQYSDRQIMSRVLARDPLPPEHSLYATRVAPRPHGRPGWSAIENPRLDEIKLGRTVYQMMIRGVTQDDLREAQRQGWLTLSAKDGAHTT